MTIAVGFMCTDGIVLAADREVSTPSVKVEDRKAWIYAYPRQAPDPVLRIGIVGAGDYSFIKFASEQLDAQLAAWFGQHSDIDMDEVGEAIQSVISDIHHNHLYPYGDPHLRPEIDLLIAIWIASKGYRLVSTSLTAVTKVWNYEAVGIGRDLAHFLVRRFYADRIAMSSAMLWASYVLMHAKRYVPKCGGPSDVIAMFQSGTTGMVKKETVAEYERIATEFETAMHPAFLAVGNKEAPYLTLVDDLAIKLKTLHDPNFLQQQVEQVRRDIVLQAGVQALGAVGEVFGSWITQRVAEGHNVVDGAFVKPDEPPRGSDPEEK
jgi:20S proteasome alpha/beta subunit